MSVTSWVANVSRILRGRPVWSAEAEYGYYRVDAELCAAHRRNQENFANEAHFTGLQIARAHGLLDTSAVAGARVLDIGAGECCLAEALALALGAEQVWAIDAVPKQIWAAAERYAAEPRLEFVVTDAQNLPFADGSFDLVTANLVLHHLEPLGPVLSEVARVLRPGGRFTAAEPSPLTGLLVHGVTSRNEAPLWPRRITDALTGAGLEHAEATYYWSRLATSALGPLSPGYRVSARKPGLANRQPGPLRRPLEKARLPGLWIDPATPFRPLIHEQESSIIELASPRASRQAT